ncbi:conserved hypothetical protein [Desulfarculus baarsii DSM 2075]|uniref:Uncharacterized protein n=1 Tax=Desulfarculus baarsii (strain ATCC 33931 / DSM 2075 / LMG 7858 / VKM B-1802 / 2st14) TaxID=644282 RepID=E1QHV5_DESB2|nr:hypothetical protein [Desulfarculus baarsii]ADK85148.1 conserved hypothetical protein [Desulfarculus baarsii DSM 2075]
MSVDQREILAQAAQRRQQALAIAAELGLLERWGRFGRPVIVGAVAHGLVCAPDIDMEIYCPKLNIAHGFEVLAQCAAGSRRVSAVYFENHLHDADKALYWQIKYRDDQDVEWKVDMWSAPDDYALPRGEHLIAPLAGVMTDELRAAILALKQELRASDAVSCLSIDLYRAVVDGGVRDMAQLRRWMDDNPIGQLSDWLPAAR